MKKKNRKPLIESGRKTLGPGGVPMSCGGFTLIETLVATSVLAISLVVIFQLFSGGLKSGKLSDEYTLGIFHAREKIEEILLMSELAPGMSEGEFEDKYKWKAEILLVEAEEEGEAERLPFEKFNITVDVSWESGNSEKHLQLTTVKLTEKTRSEG